MPLQHLMHPLVHYSREHLVRAGHSHACYSQLKLMSSATFWFLRHSPTWNKASIIYQLHVTGQLPGGRQRSSLLDAMRSYIISQCWLEVNYEYFVGNAAKGLQHPGPGKT